MNSFATAVFGCSIVFAFLALLATSGRFYARKLKKVGIGADDWIIAADTILVLGLAIMTMWACVWGGIGLKIDEMTPGIAVSYLKETWANELLVTPIIGTVKIAVLIFYKRIFITPTFKFVANVFIALCICWTIAFTCTLAFNLIPFNLEWDLEPDRPHNLDFGAMLISMAVLDLVLDVCILSLPVFVIKQLNLSRKRKLIVVGLLWTGAFCVIASAIRLAYITQFLNVEGTDDAFSNVTAEIALWCVIEPCASIVAASLPTLGPLFTKGQGLHALLTRTRRAFSGFTYRARLNGSKRSQSDSSAASDFRGNEAWQKIGGERTITTVELGAVSTEPSQSGIRVDRSFASEVV